MKQGDIYIVSLDPTMGSEQAKTRPCVIISTDSVNDFANTVTIAPLSSRVRDKPFRFHIPFNEGIIKVEQLRTVDKKRLLNKTGFITPLVKRKIKRALQLYFELY